MNPRPSVKALLLQMKLDNDYEMRTLAEETILNRFEDLEAKFKKADKDYRHLWNALAVASWNMNPAIVEFTKSVYDWLRENKPSETLEALPDERK